MQCFLWQNIICRFDVPREITVDNGLQFNATPFKEFCDSMGITLQFASVGHPQSNRAVERANGAISAAIKKRLVGLPKGKWPGELHSVLWSLRTTVTRPTGFTPFKLLFGDEAVTLEEIKAGSRRVLVQAPAEECQLSLDLLDGDRASATQHVIKYAWQMVRARGRSIYPLEFQPGDLVLKMALHAEMVGKLESKWQGMYVVAEALQKGAYRLATLEGQTFCHTWNADRL